MLIDILLKKKPFKLFKFCFLFQYHTAKSCLGAKKNLYGKKPTKKN